MEISSKKVSLSVPGLIQLPEFLAFLPLFDVFVFPDFSYLLVVVLAL
jgi:hypothetical protein